MRKRIIEYLKTHSVKQLFQLIDSQYGLGRLECFIASNWFNPLATLWLNLRSFPFMQAIRIPIFVYGHPRFYCLSGSMEVKGKISVGMIRFNYVFPGAPSLMSVQSELNNRGHIIFHGKGHIGTGNKIVVSFGKTFELGNSFRISEFCNIGVFNGISIGNGTRIAHRCQIFDSNYHYIANFNNQTIPRYDKPVRIGRWCWICNSSTVAPGSIIPDNTIVASHSLVQKDFSDIPVFSLLGGIPAKRIASNILRVYNKEKEYNINKFYKDHPDCTFYIDDDPSPKSYGEDRE